jgi:formate/nitrite transporter FocA (FNT family)
MVDADESKIFMSTWDTVIRAYMAGAILALAAWFAVTVNVHTGQPIVGALLFPIGFCMLCLLGFDLLSGVFVLSPLAFVGNLGLAERSGSCCYRRSPGVTAFAVE